jgi:2-keto-4-pentenoate hydratase/2-oxohepta-3-ene-1,7-dioic acid hydratase in catechol pathway
MRLLSFLYRGRPAYGVRRGDGVVDLTLAAPYLPRGLKGLLAAGPEALERARDAVAAAGPEAVLPLDAVAHLPPIPDPGKVLCLGLNYRDHAREIGMALPEFPVVFMRGVTSLVAHGGALVRPRVSEQLDYEAELAVVVGRRCRHLSPDEALGAVAGYACFNDATLRDYQYRASQWTMGKNFDATGGFGPELVTPDELPGGADALGIRSRLNGRVVQESNTEQHVFDVRTTLSILSATMTLEPGDVIALGTPSGVGSARKPPLWMKAGDVCEVEIDGIGTLRNTVADEA